MKKLLTSSSSFRDIKFGGDFLHRRETTLNQVDYYNQFLVKGLLVCNALCVIADVFSSVQNGFLLSQSGYAFVILLVFIGIAERITVSYYNSRLLKKNKKISDQIFHNYFWKVFSSILLLSFVVITFLPLNDAWSAFFDAYPGIGLLAFPMAYALIKAVEYIKNNIGLNKTLYVLTGVVAVVDFQISFQNGIN